LRIVTDGIILVNVVFRIQIARCRRLRVFIQSFKYLFFLHGVLQILPCWNETRAAGLYYFIEPLSRFNSIDFVKRVFRKGGDAEILPGAGRGPRRGKQSRAALHRPRQ
jgi:hypothetical protein